jgi:hypothetical protein
MWVAALVRCRIVVSREQERLSSDGGDFELKGEITLPERWPSEKEEHEIDFLLRRSDAARIEGTYTSRELKYIYCISNS